MNDNKDLFLELHPAQRMHLQYRLGQLSAFLQRGNLGPTYRTDILMGIKAAADCLLTNANYAETLAIVDACVSQEHKRCPQQAAYDER